MQPLHVHFLYTLQGKRFAGGAEPHLGDLCVFGCLRAIEGLDTHTELLRETGVADWYNRMLAVLHYAPMQ
jgi:microsomal prostaglandin-E synthase 2